VSAQTPDDGAGWRGRYHDGLTASGQAVAVRLGADALEITRDDDGRPVARWPYGALAAIEPVRAGRPAVLARGLEDDARLTLTRPCEFAALLARAPQLVRRPGAGPGRAAAHAGAWLAALAALAAALWFGWPAVADGLATLIPASVEARIGAAARTQMIGPSKVCDAAPGQAVLDRLVERLTGAMGYAPPVTVTVVDLPVVNAFALPGNRILVFRRLLAEAQSPEELAAVLAHELGHAAADHATRNLVRQFGLGLFIMALSGNSSWDGVAHMLLAAAYTRAFEEEADARALATLKAAGIGGQGWIDFFDRHAQGGGRWDRAIAYFSNHPASVERRELARQLPPTGTPVMSAGDWLVLQTICAG
jgi:Zn-dependent protease with chaperone function